MMELFKAIAIAAGIVGGISVLIGILLGVIGRVFAVKVDEREVAVREALPGNNCGGCGYPGCDGLAKAIAAGEAPVGGCPVGGQPVADIIAGIMGVEAGTVEKKVAFVHCSGTCDKAKRAYNYYGAADCRQAAVAPGYAGGACSFGCFGLGSCVSVCPDEAIRVVDGVARVDSTKCGACGQCAAVCPQHLISIRSLSASVQVACSSKAPGKAVKAVCDAGCIGCGICQKNCPNGAITVSDNLAHIDPALCTGCGVCATKCPVKIIHTEN